MQAERIGFRSIQFIFHEAPNCEVYLQNTVLTQTYRKEVVTAPHEKWEARVSMGTKSIDASYDI